jgi:MSHA type pilus biogenesis protein MshL
VPLKTKTVSIVVRNSSLGDVLHVLAEASGLNLLIDRDVNLDQRVTLSLKNALAEDALSIIFSDLDYFYSIDNNVLKVETTATRIFELGHPALVNSYAMDVGGDILSTSGNGLKGTITTGNKADVKAYDFWESMEKSLESIMGKQQLTASAGAKAPPARASQASDQAGANGGTFGAGDQADRNGRSAGAGDQAGVAAREPSAGAPSKSETGPTPANWSAAGREQNLTVNRLTGTIMVTAYRKTMDRVEHYLESVKKILGRQVMIEARIIEVQLNDTLQFGIDWSLLEKTGAGTINAGFGSLNIPTTSFNNATQAAASTSSFQLGTSSANFQALLTALQTQGNIRTLSNPKISVLNGHASLLTVGTNTSFVSKVTTTTTATAAGNSISFVPETTSVLTGLIIGIVPYISEAGEISLNITPITSDLISLTDKTFGSAGNQLTITIPVVALREMTTTVKMWDGQTVIIGGLISNNTTTNEQKIPILGSIPYLGKLFTRINNSESRSELVLLLRPSLVESP